MERNQLGEEKIGRLLVRFAVPSVISMLVSALYNIVDQIFIGNGIGINGNAATNVAFPLSTLCTSLALLFGIGGAANFNLCMGAGEHKRAGKYVGNSIFLLLSSGILLCVLVRIFLQPLMLLFGALPALFLLVVAIELIRRGWKKLKAAVPVWVENRRKRRYEARRGA